MSLLTAGNWRLYISAQFPRDFFSTASEGVVAIKQQVICRSEYLLFGT